MLNCFSPDIIVVVVIYVVDTLSGIFVLVYDHRKADADNGFVVFVIIIVVVVVCAVDTLCIFVLVYDHRRAEPDNGLPTPKKGGRPALTAKSPSTDLVLETE